MTVILTSMAALPLAEMNNVRGNPDRRVLAYMNKSTGEHQPTFSAGVSIQRSFPDEHPLPQLHRPACPAIFPRAGGGGAGIPPGPAWAAPTPPGAIPPP